MTMRYSSAVLVAAALLLAGCPEKPATCAPSCSGKSCGSDGCGGSCGACKDNEACTDAGKCQCVPNCDGKNCGDDGCGGSCGTCADGKSCDAYGFCGDCQDTGGSVKFDQLCEVLNRGFKKHFAWKYRACGLPVTDEDALHLDIGPVLGIGSTWESAADRAITMTCDQELKVTHEPLRSAVRAHRVCFDSKAVDDCIAAGNAEKAAGHAGVDPAEVCNKFYVPNQKLGEDCFYDFECTEGYCRAENLGLACNQAAPGKGARGTCTAPLAAGTPCYPDYDACIDGAVCVQVSEDAVPVCAVLPEIGQPCVAGQCKTGVCGADAEGNPLCVALPEVGQPCVAGKCKAGICEKDAEGKMMCKPFRAADEVCSQTAPCAEGLICEKQPQADPKATPVYQCKAIRTADQACEVDAQCAKDLSCQTLPKANPEDPVVKLCKPMKDENAACTADNECKDELLCLGAEGAKTCVKAPAQAKLNEPCGGPMKIACSLDDCLVCDGATETTAGTCKPFPTEGQPCAVIDGEKACERDGYGFLYCDEETDTCKRSPRRGEACHVSDDPEAEDGGEADLTVTQYGDCIWVDDYCKRDSATTRDGVCAPARKKAGESCFNTFNDSWECDKGLYCKGITETQPGVCSPPEADGAACTAHEDCKSGNCTANGVCAPDPTNGDTCKEIEGQQGPEFVCADGYWCDEAVFQCKPQRKAGQPCDNDAQCMTGTCGYATAASEDLVCISDCRDVGTDCLTGFDWFANYIFVSGTLVFLATRRRRKKQ